ncbi:Gfo/Idh/MocA family oxidoreductase [Bradyrhizobium acaciae]|uniref:Gfo/Idh/MocA family oxidoreductase n=1 Tax=Bradyrhizobium acaciae TaxID=2683706 RepID=UPI001E48D80A|nr:Gfo/Idh/MocA family oxidoreductase [Bradyrhizobium acaciae]MCC8979259.1 Gfo/Idh/MocA family oxidoreductase [Bradyrhizobium acaciae]
MKISVIGGGRWARTIASVLCGLPGRADQITMHSPSNAAGLRAWAAQSQFAGRLSALDTWPSAGAGSKRPDAVIVANRAGDHFEAAAGALVDGIPVLVEKPVALSRRRIEELNSIATARGTAFGGSHVFLFARYVEAYAAALASLGRPRSLRMIWTDGASDIRGGEAKSYDPAVTLFDDVLPHIVPLVGELRFRNLALVALDVRRGGARLAIEAQANGLPVSLLIARNDQGRQRRIEVETESGVAILDFADEPAVIDIAGTRMNGDPQWTTALRPLATMLCAFIAAVEGAPLDPRLSPDWAIASATFAEVVRGRYIAHQAEWLATRLGEPLDTELLYAFAEFGSNEAGSADSISKAWPTIADQAELKMFLARSRLFFDAG